MNELSYQCDKVIIHVDNQSAIKLTKNPEYHNRMKHIEVRYHFIRDVYQRGETDVRYIESKEQIADILTKPLPKQTFSYLRNKLSVYGDTK